MLGGAGASLSKDQIAFINKHCGIDLNIDQIDFIDRQGKEEELKEELNKSNVPWKFGRSCIGFELGS